MAGDWVAGSVEMPSGEKVPAIRHIKTGEVYRNRGLFAIVKGAKCSPKTAATFKPYGPV